METGKPRSTCTYPIRYAVTESDLDKNISSEIAEQGQSDVKHGNPGQVTIKCGSLSDVKVSSTHYAPNRKTGLSGRDGGKIAEKANAKGNSLDTRKGITVVRQLSTVRRLNSVCLNEVVSNPVGGDTKIQDLN